MENKKYKMIKGGIDMNDSKINGASNNNIDIGKASLENLTITNRTEGNNLGMVVNLSKAPIVLERYLRGVKREELFPREVRWLGMSSQLRNRIYKFYLEVDKDSTQVYSEIKNGYSKISEIKSREIKVNKDVYLIKGDQELIYVNVKEGDIQTLKISEGRIYEIKIFNNNVYIVFEDEEICVVRNGYTIKLGLQMEWKDKKIGSEHSVDRVTHESIRFKINGRSIEIKIHQLMILLVYNQLVLSGLVLSGNSGMCIDHKNGQAYDNRIDNLHVILQVENAGKRGTTEEHLEQSKKCYNYLPELEEISNKILDRLKDVA